MGRSTSWRTIPWLASIAGWLGETDRQLKQVQELVRRELADWRQDPSLSLSQGKFARVNAARESLPLTNEETAFLARAAVLFGAEIPYWLARAGGPDRQVDILLEMLAGPAAAARLHAAQALAEYFVEPVALSLAHAALEDAEPAVRDMAAGSLAAVNGQAGLHVLVEVALAGDRRQRRQAIHAVALIRDAAPEQPRRRKWRRCADKWAPS